MYFHGARFSNYEAWLSDPTHIKPSAQVVWPIVGQEILNADVGGGFQGLAEFLILRFALFALPVQLCDLLLKFSLFFSELLNLLVSG